MLRNISNKLYQLSSGLITLLALLIFAIFVAFVLPSQAKRAEAVSGDAGSPDTSYIYPRADTRALEALPQCKIKLKN